MSEIKIQIDGREVSASEESTILEAARSAGIHIPTLCYVEGKSSEVPCQLCLVEIVGQEQPVRACATPVSSGMEIVTASKTLVEHRKERLSALAETHFGDCKAPCNLTCPGQINVQGYIAHVAKGQYEEAVRLVMERNPFPFSVGRVCPRFCETRCRRLLVDEPVSINHLKRFVADWCMTHKVDLKLKPASATGKRVAVVGGGPAGLTGAYYLALKGHDVTVFEAAPKLGGMLRYGLPRYKIPDTVLDYEISTILRLGVSVRLGQRWGRDFTLQTLKDQGFGSILLTVGANHDEPLEIEGGSLPGVVPALKFLHRVNESGEISDGYGKRAMVVGGGNVAMESARSLLRCGVDEVTVVYPRAQTEMLANQRNIREAEEEGVQFLLMASPIKIGQGSGAAGEKLDVELIRMKLGEPDAKGIRYPEAIPGSTVHMGVDTVVVAMGQAASSGGFAGGELEQGLELTPKNNIKSNPRNFQTNIPGVYAAGDATNGPRSVIQSVVAARRAADNIHLALMDLGKVAPESRFNFSRGKTFDSVDLANFEGVRVKLREKMPQRPPERAIQDFHEVRLGFSEDMAKNEAARCLSCGCNAFDRCDLKRLSIEHGVDPNKTGMGTKPIYSRRQDHPTISVDINKCIYCRNCVNSCEYGAIDLSAASFDEKGRAQDISFTFNERCVSCGKCVDNCSTGALNKKDQIIPIVSEEVRLVRTTCPYCGAGCQMNLKVKGDTIIEVTADPEMAPNYGALCVKGRFGFHFVQDRQRLTKPLIRKGGQLVECSWDEALTYTAKRFFDIKSMYGADAIAGFSCARATNEENFLMQKFMRTAIGTNNIDHCARL